MIYLLPVPTSSFHLQKTLTRIQGLASSDFCVDRHIKAVAQTVAAVFITTLDTLVYSAKALTQCFIQIIDLEISKGFVAFVQHGTEAAYSLYMIVSLTTCAALGFFFPQTVLGNFPIFSDSIDYEVTSEQLKQKVIEIQDELDRLQKDRLHASCSPLTSSPVVPLLPQKTPSSLTLKFLEAKWKDLHKALEREIKVQLDKLNIFKTMMPKCQGLVDACHQMDPERIQKADATLKSIQILVTVKRSVIEIESLFMREIELIHNPDTSCSMPIKLDSIPEEPM